MADYAPSLDDLNKQYKEQVQKFRSDLPMQIAQQQQGLAGQAKSNLADTQQQIKANASGRGLLYGGLRQGAEQAAAGASAADLAAAQYNAARQAQDQSNTLSNNLINQQFAKYGGDVQAYDQYNQLQQAKYQNAQNQKAGLFGGLGQLAGGAIGMFSDRELKTNIESIKDSELNDLLDNIKPQIYDYKDQKHGEGKHFSPMAQDLEKSEIGKSLVEDTPEGKFVNTGKAIGAVMSIQAALNNRLKKLEAKNGSV